MPRGNHVTVEQKIKMILLFQKYPTYSNIRIANVVGTSQNSVARYRNMFLAGEPIVMQEEIDLYYANQPKTARLEAPVCDPEPEEPEEEAPAADPEPEEKTPDPKEQEIHRLSITPDQAQATLAYVHSMMESDKKYELYVFTKEVSSQ